MEISFKLENRLKSRKKLSQSVAEPSGSDFRVFLYWKSTEKLGKVQNFEKWIISKKEKLFRPRKNPTVLAKVIWRWWEDYCERKKEVEIKNKEKNYAVKQITMRKEKCIEK